MTQVEVKKERLSDEGQQLSAAFARLMQHLKSHDCTACLRLLSLVKTLTAQLEGYSQKTAGTGVEANGSLAEFSQLSINRQVGQLKKLLLKLPRQRRPVIKNPDIASWRQEHRDKLFLVLTRLTQQEANRQKDEIQSDMKSYFRRE